MSRALWTHLVKDLRIEWRSKEAINSMLFFALLVVVLFSLAFDPRGAVAREIAGGVLTVALLFASVSALNQAWAREIRHQVLDAQRMAPSSGSDLLLAKIIANFLFVTIVQVVLAPVFMVMYNLRVVGNGWLLVLVLPLGTWALVANGTFFAALSIRSRNRELLLPLILFPIFMPALHGHGAGHPVDPDRRKRSDLVDQAAARLRHHLHHREPAAVRGGAARGMRPCRHGREIFVATNITPAHPRLRIGNSQAAPDAQRRPAVPYSISTLLTRNLHQVFGEIDSARRRAAMDEIYNEDVVFYDPKGGVFRGRDEIDRIAGAIKATHPDFQYQPIAEPEEVGDGGRVQWVSGRPGEAPAYAGTDFIIARDGRISAIYLFFEKLN